MHVINTGDFLLAAKNPDKNPFFKMDIRDKFEGFTKDVSCDLLGCGGTLRRRTGAM